MRGRILMMLALAVGGGAASLFAANAWLDGQANARRAEAPTGAPAVPLSTIVVAAQPLRFGVTLTAENLKTIPWPSEALPAGAFAEVSDLLAGGPRRVLSPMEPSEPVLAAKLTGAGEGANLSRLIEEGRRAVTIRVDDVAGVAGFLMPGDLVDVVLTRESTGGSQGDVILQGVKVLTVDQSADTRNLTPQVARAVTVEVDPAGAQKIALAQAVGSLSLMLRRAGETDAAEVPGISSADLVSRAKALAAVSNIIPAGEEENRATTVWVSRAMERTSYEVPATSPLSPPVDLAARQKAGDVVAARETADAEGKVQ